MQENNTVSEQKYWIDSELYYKNLEGIPENVAHMVKINSENTLRTISEYLARAREAKIKTQFRVCVKESRKNNLSIQVDSEGNNKNSSDSKKGYWVEIGEHPEDDFEKTDTVMKAFFDAKQVLQSKENTNKNRIRVLDSSPETSELLLEKKPANNTIYLRPDTNVIERERKALFSLKDKPDKLRRPLIRLLENADMSQWPNVTPQPIDEWYLLTDESRPGTIDQREFVKVAMGTPDFAFLEGPPGSGKTTAICEYILQVILRGGKVLLCASTHVAVDNVLERLKNNPEIIAVRIGDPHNISEDVAHLQIDKRKKVEKEAISRFLQEKGKPSESQKYLFDALQNDDDSTITDMILDSANLVCGTTIGILQHPLIRAKRENPVPIYDVMILDEASKTTFQEFLVPALYARKWVLVGDTKQLSPYVDDMDVSSNIETLLSKKQGEVCVNIFNCIDGHNMLIVEDDDDTLNRYKQQARTHEIDISILDPRRTDSTEKIGLDITSSQAIIADSASIEKYSNMLPMDLSIVKGDISLPELERRRSYWRNHYRKSAKIEKDLEENVWHLELAWRLVRSYELRNIENGPERYLDAIQNLLPRWSREELDKTESAINSIKKIALPSIIELLQEGFERRRGQNESVLSDGFRDEDLKPRHVLLRYQHRMHPEISSFPRVHIYGNIENDSDGCLNDPDYILSERQWDYKRYKSRILWVDVKGKRDKNRHFNAREANAIEKELKNFIEWATVHPRENSDEIWEVAVLTFYLAQEKELRRRLQKYFKTGNTRNFWTKNREVHVTLCTVDRFQGHEADIVFLSFVRDGGVGFLDSPNRLNVALTRARYQLVLVGNRDIFKRQKRSELLQKLAIEIPSDIDYGEM